MAKRGRLTRDKGAVGNDINAIQAQESMKRIMEFLKVHPEQALAVHHALEAGFFVGKVDMELAACWPPTYMYFNGGVPPASFRGTKKYKPNSPPSQGSRAYTPPRASYGTRQDGLHRYAC